MFVFKLMFVVFRIISQKYCKSLIYAKKNSVYPPQLTKFNIRFGYAILYTAVILRCISGIAR